MSKGDARGEPGSPLLLKSLGNRFKTGTISANTKILDDDIENPDDEDIVMVRLWITVDTSAKLRTVVKKGTDEIEETMRDDSQLKANTAYVFDILLEASYSLNFKLDANAKVQRINVTYVETGEN